MNNLVFQNLLGCRPGSHFFVVICFRKSGIFKQTCFIILKFRKFQNDLWRLFANVVNLGFLLLIVGGGGNRNGRKSKFQKWFLNLGSDMVNNSISQRCFFLFWGALVDISKSQKYLLLFGVRYGQHFKISKLIFAFGVRTQGDPGEPRRAQESA